MINQPPPAPGEHSCARRHSRRYRGARLLAASVAIAGLSITPVLLTATASTASAQQETPAQRCARETATYNQAMESAWRAANPGKTPPAGAWPAYVCQELPTIELPPGGGNSTGGNSTGGGSGNNAPGRDHRYQGSDHNNVYGQDMQVGDPRTGLTDRTSSTDPTTTSRAADTARSNVPVVPAWATPREVTVTDETGATRQVRVIDTDQGVAVIDGAGVATGDMLTTGGSNDDDKGAPSTRGVEGLAGVNLLDQRSTDSSSGPDDGHGPADPMGPGPLGAMAAAAGGIGVLAKRRRTRVGGAPRLASGIVHSDGLPSLNSVPGLDSAPRVTINHLTGAEQTIFALLSPQSDHTQDFDLDVPPGGDAVIRPDGGVDVVDANGNIVSQVAPPWAYDAQGRPQNTWYTYNPDTGLLTQHVEPAGDALYPIIADPIVGSPLWFIAEALEWEKDLYDLYYFFATFNEVLDAMDTMNEGLDAMNQGANTMNEGINQTNDALGGMNEGLDTANEGLDTANEGLRQTNEGVNRTFDALESTIDAIDRIPSIGLEERQEASGGEYGANSPNSDSFFIEGVFAGIDYMFNQFGDSVSGDTGAENAFRNGARIFSGVGLGLGVMDDLDNGESLPDSLIANGASLGATTALTALWAPLGIVGIVAGPAIHDTVLDALNDE